LGTREVVFHTGSLRRFHVATQVAQGIIRPLLPAATLMRPKGRAPETVSGYTLANC
jgi:hypothetical protein